MGDDGNRGRLLVLLTLLLTLVSTWGCDGKGPGFKPAPGLHGIVNLQNQSDMSGVLVRVVPLDSVAVTDSAGAFSFEDIPDGHWRVEASYPYFGTGAADVEVRDGLQLNAVKIALKQLLSFWVELPDTVLSFCKCENSFEFDIDGYVFNLTKDEVVVFCGSTPLADFAITADSGNPRRFDAVSDAGGFAGPGPAGFASKPRTFNVCAVDAMLLPGDQDMPGSVTLGALKTRVFHLRARLLSVCYEDGLYDIYWALVDCSNHPEHYSFDAPALNRTLLGKRGLLRPAKIRLESSN